LSEIKRIHSAVDTQEFFGVFAYATQSGASSFDLEFGNEFWQATPSRWLFGIDYGRTQPQALRFMCDKQNADVRIFDGSWLVEQNGFIPRRDFHAKMSLLLNAGAQQYGMVVGSGNFSSNGLRKSIEAGAALQTNDENVFNTSIKPTADLANALWNDATPAGSILDAYEEKWYALSTNATSDDESVDVPDIDPGTVFWIEAGYVTKNRGPDRPGNQIDFPRGMCRYFGFDPPEDLLSNTVIGEVTFETTLGDPVSNNLRLGNNMMEKISLPIPETHGFDIYDGKVLVFQRTDGRFEMWALEADDFQTVFGDKLSAVKVMGSGRRYGSIK